MNPLTFVLPELHGYIFQHFKLEVFKTSTRISPSWNDALSEPRVMKKSNEIFRVLLLAFKLFTAKIISSTNEKLIKSFQFQKLYIYFHKIGDNMRTNLYDSVLLVS